MKLLIVFFVVVQIGAVTVTDKLKRILDDVATFEQSDKYITVRLLPLNQTGLASVQNTGHTINIDRSINDDSFAEKFTNLYLFNGDAALDDASVKFKNIYKNYILYLLDAETESSDVQLFNEIDYFYNGVSARNGGTIKNIIKNETEAYTSVLRDNCNNAVDLFSSHLSGCIERVIEKFDKNGSIKRLGAYMFLQNDGYIIGVKNIRVGPSDQIRYFPALKGLYFSEQNQYKAKVINGYGLDTLNFSELKFDINIDRERHYQESSVGKIFHRAAISNHYVPPSELKNCKKSVNGFLEDITKRIPIKSLVAVDCVLSESDELAQSTGNKITVNSVSWSKYPIRSQETIYLPFYYFIIGHELGHIINSTSHSDNVAVLDKELKADETALQALSLISVESENKIHEVRGILYKIYSLKNASNELKDGRDKAFTKTLKKKDYWEVEDVKINFENIEFASGLGSPSEILPKFIRQKKSNEESFITVFYLNKDSGCYLYGIRFPNRVYEYDATGKDLRDCTYFHQINSQAKFKFTDDYEYINDKDNHSLILTKKNLPKFLGKLEGLLTEKKRYFFEKGQKNGKIRFNNREVGEFISAAN